MKIGQDFSEVGTLEAGKLVFKFPGTDIQLLYEGGRVYLSKSGVGYVSLQIRDACYEKVGKVKGMAGSLGRRIAEGLCDPSVRPALTKLLKSGDHSLFYSKAEKGVEILCLPTMSGKSFIDGESIPMMVIAGYAMEGIPLPEKVYAHHMEAVGNKRLITDRTTLEKEVMQLVSKANHAYELALEQMKKIGF